jgi:iron complex outermembrane recepter protein
MKKSIFYLLSVGVLAISAFGQNAGKVGGKVTNADGKPVINATVSLEGTTRSTRTDADGEFTLEAVEPGEYNLIVTSNEYAPQSAAVTIGGAAASAAVNITLQTLAETVNVVGRVSEYHTDDTTVATKIPTRLIDTPQSITSISPQIIADRLATDVNDIYKNVAGLNQTTYSAVVFRGFTQRETLFNGVRGNPYGSLEGDVNNSGFSTSILRLSNVERIEVLKGPASVLYGSSEPGGVINFITKKPKTVLDGTAEFRFGQYGLAMGNVDVSVPLGKRVFTRAASFLERRGGFRNNTALENQNYVGNLLWQPDDATRVSFEYEYIAQNQQGHRLRGVPVDANGRFITDISFTTTEKTDFVKLFANVFQANVSRDFFTDGRVDATFRYLTNNRFENYHEPRGLLPDGRTMRRDFRDQIRRNRDFSFSLNAYKPFDFGNFGVHTLNAGAEYYRQDHQFRLVSVAAGVPSIDIFNPVYGLANPRNYVFNPNSTPFSLAEPSRVGFYLQNQIAFNKYFQLVAGGRVERYKDTGRSGTVPLSAEDSAFTGRIGAVVKPRDNISVYGNFANSYARPPILSQTPSANGPFAPERGRQFEAGAKFELLGGRMFVTSSVYQIEKTGVLRPDPNAGIGAVSPNALLQTGAIRNRGFDIDANGAITRRWNFSFNYSHINSRITRDVVASVVGKPSPNVPANTVGFFTRYDFTPEIGVGFGGEFVGDRIEPYANLKAPSYKTFDASYYHTFFKRFRFYAKLENLTNERYALSSLFAARVGNFPGQPRTFSAGLTILSFRKR